MNKGVAKFAVTTNSLQGDDRQWMELALSQAHEAAQAGEVPIGAVLVRHGELLAKAHNKPISTNNPCAHAEIRAIEQACQRVKDYRLGAQSTLYVTLQPCVMCLGAILHARIGRVVIGCPESRFNDLDESLGLFNRNEAWHPCAFETGCMQDECQQVLSGFFQQRRQSRLQSVEQLESLLHLPNVNKQTQQLLNALGYQSGADIVNAGLENVAQEMQRVALEQKQQGDTQQAAIFESLQDFFMGEPAKSWKQYV